MVQAEVLGWYELTAMLMRIFLQLCKYGALDGLIPGHGNPGLQAYIHVDDMEGNELLHIAVEPDGTLGINPFDELRDKYFEWRAKNPCPKTGGDGGSGDNGDMTTKSASSASTFYLFSPIATPLVLGYLL